MPYTGASAHDREDRTEDAARREILRPAPSWRRRAVELKTLPRRIISPQRSAKHAVRRGTARPSIVGSGRMLSAQTLADRGALRGAFRDGEDVGCSCTYLR